jgi:hypothetical protein
MNELPLSQWKEDRQEFLDSRSDWQVMMDNIAYKKYSTDESFYGLAEEIRARQESKMPIAGEGAVMFFSELTYWGKPLSKLGWPALLIYTAFEGMERWLKYETGIEYTA